VDHHKILRTIIDDGGSATEEQILDGKRLDGQSDAAYRVDHSLPKMVAAGLLTLEGDVYTITQAGRDYVKH
jgi:hypothetical protein